MMQEEANRASAAAAAAWRYKNNSLDQRAASRAPHVSVNNSAIDGVSKWDLHW